MPNSVYKIAEIIGTSAQSWEDAVKNAVETAATTLRDLRVAEVSELDITVDNGKVSAYRAKVKLSFKYEGPDEEWREASGTARPAAKKKPSKKKTRR